MISGDWSRFSIDSPDRSRGETRGHDRGRPIDQRVPVAVPLAFVTDVQRDRFAHCSAFCRRWSGFRPTSFLSRTGVQGSVPHAASLSSCQPTSTCQGGNELSPESAGNCWCRVALTNDGSTSGVTQSFATHTAHFLDWECARCGVAF